MVLRRPRQWGAGWLGCELWEHLGLGEFWRAKLSPGREGTRWDQVLQTLVLYRLIDPGCEWRLHRHWFEHTALADLLGGDFALAEIHRLYECHDKLVAHKAALFHHLSARWRDLFDAKFEVLLYDLTSTYFDSNPPADPRRPAPLRLRPRQTRRLRASRHRPHRHTRGSNSHFGPERGIYPASWSGILNALGLFPALLAVAS